MTAVDFGTQDYSIFGAGCPVQYNTNNQNTGSEDFWLFGVPSTVQYQQTSAAAPIVQEVLYTSMVE